MKRIIVADDSATARMFIKRCLQIIGLGDAEIIEAEHGKEAMSGSLIVAAFDSLEAVQEWASEEPYLKAGVYSHVDIKPFIKTLPSA